MSLIQPFLSLDTSKKETYLLIVWFFNSKWGDMKQTNFTGKGWTALKEQALLWSKIHIPSELPKFALRKF
jgi:hypothetical protein